MRAFFPGSFDPPTNGHLDIIQRASQVFEELVVVITYNPNKSSGLFSAEERKELMEEITQDLPNVRVDLCTGLVAEYGKNNGFTAIIKGLRNITDFSYEEPMAHMNRSLEGIDTYFLLTNPEWAYVSSSLVKEVARYGGDIKKFLPEPVHHALVEKTHPTAS